MIPRVVNAPGGRRRPSAHQGVRTARNRCSASAGMSVRLAPESVFEMARCTQVCTGLLPFGAHLAPENASALPGGATARPRALAVPGGAIGGEVRRRLLPPLPFKPNVPEHGLQLGGEGSAVL
jgi:hypothetical protein